ncbi:hypothetical protein M8J77_024170 [Diaphorina citri]|nr:hypothetical protein M8J77_024170 [Diaphorina citri]
MRCAFSNHDSPFSGHQGTCGTVTTFLSCDMLHSNDKSGDDIKSILLSVLLYSQGARLGPNIQVLTMKFYNDKFYHPPLL